MESATRHHKIVTLTQPKMYFWSDKGPYNLKWYNPPHLYLPPIYQSSLQASSTFHLLRQNELIEPNIL